MGLRKCGGPRQEVERRYPAEAVIGPLGVVAREPFGAELADPAQGVKRVGVEDFSPVAAIEALEVGKLPRQVDSGELTHPRDVQWDKRHGREPRAVYTGQDIMKSLLAAVGWQGELQRLSSDTLVNRDTISVSHRQRLWCADSSVVGEVNRSVNDGGSRR